jgi:hypothetical protein
MFFRRRWFFLLFVAATTTNSSGADNILFVGNSFTIGSSAPTVSKNGGVPMLVEQIARAKGKLLASSALMAGGKDWSYHLAQPETAVMLRAKNWTWVVLQDYSTLPTHVGNIAQFLHDGETFSDRIAAASPSAGLVLFETWARPPGAFYNGKPGHDFSGPAQMMTELHQSYARLRDDLVARNSHRLVRVALVGTAFARANAEYPAINLNAPDHHHASPDGYYLAALVIYETIYHDSVRGASSRFYHGALDIPADDATRLQAVADEVAGAPVK